MEDKVISGRYSILDDEEALQDVIEKTGITRGEIEDLVADFERDEKKELGN
jgi:hypothetical protein